MVQPLHSPKDNPPPPDKGKDSDDPKHTIGWLKAIFHFIVEWRAEKENKLDKILMNQAELLAQLNAVLAQTKKTNAEIARVNGQLVTLQTTADALTAKVAELQALLDAGGTITPELVQVGADLVVAAQANDDAIPDEIVVPPPVP